MGIFDTPPPDPRVIWQSLETFLVIMTGCRGRGWCSWHLVVEAMDATKPPAVTGQPPKQRTIWPQQFSLRNFELEEF